MEFKPENDTDTFRSAHRASDTDFDKSSLHHTLGKSGNQAAPGNHNHDGVYAAGVHQHIENDIANLPTDLANINAAIATKLNANAAAGGDLAGNYPNPTIGLLKVTDAHVAAANKDGGLGVPSMRTIGTGSAQAAAGNHRHRPYYEEAASTGSVNPMVVAATDVPGATLTVPVDSTNDIFEVVGIFDFITSAIGASVCLGELYVGGVKETNEALFRGAAANDRATVQYTWRVTGQATGNVVFKIAARINAVGSTYVCSSPRTKIMVKKVANFV